MGRFSGAGTAYIEPGSPWQNPWVESYGSRMRDELLAIEQFDTLLEAQVLVADWRREYNEYRPHSALGMLTRVRSAVADQPTAAHIAGGPIIGVRSPTPPPSAGQIHRPRPKREHLSLRRPDRLGIPPLRGGIAYEE